MLICIRFNSCEVRRLNLALRHSKNETELKRNEKIVQDARSFVRKIKQGPSESKALKIVLVTVILCFFVLCSLGLLSELSSGKELYREEAKNLLLATEQKP